ncbi:MAG: XdhC/CoxI family protein [Planctomycetota bacterium]|jgi:xanthine dehydrogenase accessory factor|nr:XdhC/CoxI family protein [Planctomycetota bacterium]
MDSHSDIFEEIVRLRQLGVPTALCTILLTQGSTPGKETMRMLVRIDGTTLGSVGGGCVESEVIEIAQKVLRTGRTETKSFSLNRKDLPESGLICGGQVTILVEPVVSPRLILFGGGHVSGAASRVAKECEIQTTILDDRPEYANSTRHSAASDCRSGSWKELVESIGSAEHQFVVVATRGHQADLEVLQAMAQAGCQPRYLGLLGSKAKKASLERVLEDEGVPNDFIQSIQTPIGLPIGSKSAGEIAVSLLAELVQLRNMESPKESRIQALATD